MARARGRRNAPRGRGRKRSPRDPVVFHGAHAYEDADFLEHAALGSQIVTGHFGVSGWVVSGVREPLSVGYARRSTLEAAGFKVVPTPALGRGHVTILFSGDYVDEDEARAFNACFGR